MQRKRGFVTSPKGRRSASALYQFDVVDHPVHNVRLAHQRRHVQPAQAEQWGVEEELRQLACPQHPVVVGQYRAVAVVVQRQQRFYPSNPNTRTAKNKAREGAKDKHTRTHNGRNKR